MNKKSIVAVMATITACATPAVAHAHVTLQPSEVPAGAFTRLDVRVPNERDNASTTKVTVRFPPGFIFVSYEPVPEWSTKVAMATLATPVEAHGEKHTEQVSQVTFTAKAGGIAPGQFQDFGLSVGLPDTPGTLTFKALQTYSNGEVVRWIGPPDADEPAPQVTLAAAHGEAAGGHHAAAAPAAASDEADGGDGGGDGVALAALVVAVGGLLFGGGALLLAARRGGGRARA